MVWYAPDGERGAARIDEYVEIGRGSVTAPIHDRHMSRSHFAIRRRRAHWELIDKGSRNGTAVNGTPVLSCIVSPGDVIRAGHSLFVLDATSRPELPDEATESFVSLGLEADARRAARGAAPVLLLGPTGAGKSHLARRIHDWSRPGRPFVQVNCAEFAPSLIESALFGHVRGAFTGAARNHVGVIAAADTGTLFLDEIGTLSPELQSKLLVVLDQRVVRPVGSNTPSRMLDLRFVAATNLDIEQAVTAGVFREDLYARLRGIVLKVPPLSARRPDILPLLTNAAGRHSHAEFTPDTLEALLIHDWPHGVRELLLLGERLAQVSAPRIELHALPEPIRSLLAAGPRKAGQAPSVGLPAAPAAAAIPLGAGQPGRAEVLAALRAAGGVKSTAAKRLGIHRTQFYRLLERYGIDDD